MGAAEAEDFRIVILAEPAPGPIAPLERVAVCVPARPLSQRRAVREASPSYATGRRQSALLSRRDLELLGRGRIFASPELEIGPEQVFSPDADPRLELLAQDILLQAALRPYRSALRLALTAPNPPFSAGLDELLKGVRHLAQSARRTLSQGRAQGQWPEAEQSLRRLLTLTSAKTAGEFLSRIAQTYLRLPDCAEDVYLARALLERADQAIELLGMRRFLADAIVPAAHGDLALDRTIVQSQLSFAVLVAEPHRFPSTASSFADFRRRYQQAYLQHHDDYWLATLAIHSDLMEASPRVEALRRFNTLSELGTPVGEGAATIFAQLLEETAGCPHIGRLEEELGDAALCPSCRLSLDRDPPQERARDVINRIGRALRRQMARLSSTALRQVLARSGDPRVEQFLKVVQASQLSSLAEVLDDSLLGFLRRFLVEARIQTVLQPILDRLQGGPPPQEEAAEQAMREVSRVLQRAFRAAHRTLPAPASEADRTPP